jgi:hypothetical protein
MGLGMGEVLGTFVVNMSRAPITDPSVHACVISTSATHHFVMRVVRGIQDHTSYMRNHNVRMPNNFKSP